MSESAGQLPLDFHAVSQPQPSAAVQGLRCVADWLTPDACQALLSNIDAEEWSAQLKRRVQHYGRRYDYGRRSAAGDQRAPAPPLPAWAREAAARLVREGLMDQEAEQVIVNEYQPGQGISAHVDCLPCFGPVIAAISLGSTCLMDFTDPEGGAKLAVPLAPGSLLVMTGPARHTWRHAIAARKSDPGTTGRVPRGRRVSVTFRTLLHPRPVARPIPAFLAHDERHRGSAARSCGPSTARRRWRRPIPFSAIPPGGPRCPLRGGQAAHTVVGRSDKRPVVPSCLV
ncbi:alpha-ketoglutarate-dependent dioxygenase AlkB [Streptomonospora wellingtoniae]|uniref:Alpha-ketoglutarate-dependent dioxygenase AlkB n=1 Tax=Streptomonospora wellingtoniae TaxID=3075544 RepID=A0ABU2KYC5_9ACTN|nr:alpha-ketoglutarate-dependent dioxygenase AlkB [Streptomonospora sp. DSM 45055]MDT0304300.1 alpha-ketoglutarate-dependent dioxygenase AlkB [Streptomonospora sp. DSM 45055]